MAAIRLTQRRVDTLRPRKTVRNVRDAELKGYGVRIMPSGAKRYFIHSQHRGHRVWKIVGDAAVMTEAEARARARSMLAALREDRDIEADVSGDALFETVAEEVFTRYGRRWKPRTLEVNRHYLNNQILPFFAGPARSRRSTARRCSAGSARCMQRRRRRTARRRSSPSSCSRPRPGDTVPMAAIPARASGATGRSGRSASCRPEEYRRLGMALDRHEARQPFRVAALRLLLLTGCRKSEIVTLEWRFYRDGRLYLADSKTGPRTVWLCERGAGSSRRVAAVLGILCFPMRGHRYPWSWLDAFWVQLRAEAGLDDVRLHDTRHSFASMALSSGETIRTVGRLLGHDKAATTLKYAHLSDATVRETVEALAPLLSGAQS